MLSEKELIDGQRWLACWEKVTSKPMTSRETFFARAIESAACAERDKRIAELEQELEKVRKDAERWAHACKGNNKQINVCSWDNDAYEFVGYAMKKNAIDAIADAEIAAMKGTP